MEKNGGAKWTTFELPVSITASMGAELHIKSRTPFDPVFLRRQVTDLPGATAASDSPELFSIFPGEPRGLPSFELADIADPNHPRHRHPIIIIGQDYITIGLNWSDSQGVVRKFVMWVLERFECTATCGEGGSYQNNADIQGWVDTWLKAK